MNSAEAKRILIACRPGSDDLRSAPAAAALELVQQDAELRQWWEQQQGFHEEARRRFQEIPVPARLREHILSRTKIIELPWWRRPVVWSAAAAVLLLIGMVALWQRQGQSSAESSFSTFRSRMVQSVLRQYRMDIMTNDMGYIRRFLDGHQAPSDYTLPAGLARLPAMGAGVLSWQDRRVSMVCLDSGTNGTLFLFVVDKNSMQNPPQKQVAATVKELATISWSEAGKTYVLAGSGEKEWLEGIAFP